MSESVSEEKERVTEEPQESQESTETWETAETYESEEPEVFVLKIFVCGNHKNGKG